MGLIRIKSVSKLWFILDEVMCFSSFLIYIFSGNGSTGFCDLKCSSTQQLLSFLVFLTFECSKFLQGHYSLCD